jgi:hypothetical protein
MEIVRYRPGEAIRWLRTSGEKIRQDAQSRTRSAVQQHSTGDRPVMENIRNLSGAVFNVGKGAYAQMVHHLAEGNEYVLQEKHLDIVTGNSIKTLPYDRICGVTLKGDRAILKLDQGSIVVRPVAHVVAGSVKVPVGWNRNGLEVPYELLLEELAARAGVQLLLD